MYKALRATLNSKPKLVPENFIFTGDANLDWYVSLFCYNEEQKNIYYKTNTLSGIKDTVGKVLLFDFDEKNDLELARKDAIELIINLIENYKLSEENISAYFSGCKGFTVEVLLDKYITQDEFKSAVFKLAGNLKTFDKVVNDANRVVRVVNTKHPVSGLYKIPLYLYELNEMSIDKIKELASAPRKISVKTQAGKLPDDLFKSQMVKPVINRSVENIDFTHKVKGWPNCKWALLQGFSIEQGNRHEKLLSIIAHAKYLNYTKEQAYQLAKEADRYGSEIYGGERVKKETLWQDVEYTYSPQWKGGTFSCKDGKSPWLTEICNSLGPHKCKSVEVENLIDVDKVFNEFFVYANDIDKNTIKTDIPELDDNLRLLTGQMVGLLGAPSSGKTSIALEILENTSRLGLLSVFYSLDMASSELFQKIAQRVTGYTDDKLFYIFKNDKRKSEEIGKLVTEAYSNVKFCFDTGVSVDKISESIEDFEESTGKKVKLLLLDYNELLSSPYSDATASSGFNAGALKKLTNNKQICTISLLQPPKIVGDARDEIYSYRNIKGSSLLEQCFSVVIGIYRPGFSSTNDSEDDKYMVMNILKNRLGKLFSVNFYWDGRRGKISTIDEEGKLKIKELKEKNAQKVSLF